MLDIARQLSSDNALIRFARPGSPTSSRIATARRRFMS
jgi:hypothetical protein